MKTLRIISLALLALSLFVSVDLGLNYLNATFVQLHDGVVCTSVFRPLFGDGGWSVYGFFHIFRLSLWTTLVLGLTNLALWGIQLGKHPRPHPSVAESSGIG